MAYGIDDAILQGSSDGLFFGLTKFRQIALIGSMVCFCGFLVSFFIEEKDYEASGNDQVAALGTKYSFWEIIRSLIA